MMRFKLQIAASRVKSAMDELDRKKYPKGNTVKIEIPKIKRLLK